MHEKLPLKWVERIFERLENKYKEEWRNVCTDRTKEYYITLWQNGLVGVTAQEIQRALLACELTDYHLPPTVVQFYHYAKGIKQPPKVTRDNSERGDPAIARHYLDEIKRKVSGKRNDCTKD